MRVRCIAGKPYSPPFDLVGLNFAPWFPGEERDVHDELGQKLLFDKNFERVASKEKSPEESKFKRHSKPGSPLL